MDKKIEIEAATFRRLVKHLQDNPEVQNIDPDEPSKFLQKLYF